MATARPAGVLGATTRLRRPDGSLTRLQMHYGALPSVPVEPTPVPVGASTADATVRAVTSAQLDSGTSVRTVAVPDGTVSGDLLLAVVSVDAGASGGLVLPAGFIEAARAPSSGTDLRMVVGYQRVVGVAGATVSFTLPSSADARVDLLAIRDADPGLAPVVAITTTGSSLSTHTASTAFPAAARNLAIWAVAKDEDTTAQVWDWKAPAGVRELVDAHSNGWVTQAVFTARHDSGEPIGTRSFTVTQTGGGLSSAAVAATILIPSATAAAPLVPTNVTQAAMDTSVRALYTTWKNLLVQDTAKGWWAVRADAQGGDNPYVAEGQGFGMLITAQMAPADTGARAIFDGLTRYVLDHPSSIDAGLHAAEQDAGMVSHNGSDSATDGDLDIAMGWLMAHQRWGSGGTHNYQQLALNRIAAIKRSLVSPTTGLLELGDWSSGSWQNISRTSDWMIGHFEAFAAATADPAWYTIRDAHLAAIGRLQAVHAPATGLLPDFTTGAPAAVAPAAPDTLESDQDGAYYYNACRVPWRLGAASSRLAREAAAKISTWAAGVTGGDPEAFGAGYTLAGARTTDWTDVAFTSPLLVAATHTSNQGWVNALWSYCAGRTTNTGYYSSSIQLLSMILVGGTYAVTVPTAGTYTASATGNTTGSYSDATAVSFTAAGKTSRYHRWAAHLDPARAAPLVVHLHGDGAYEYDYPQSWTTPAYVAAARAVGAMVIVPNTPDTAGSRTWWEDWSSTEWLVALIRRQFSDYNLDRRRVFLSGFSGGAVVTTSNLLADFAGDFPGGGAMLLGGGGPYETAATTPTAGQKTDFLLRWHVGELDDGRNTDDNYDARADAEAGEAQYRAAGWDTAITYIPGADHLASEEHGPAALTRLLLESNAHYGL